MLPPHSQALSMRQASTVSLPIFSIMGASGNAVATGWGVDVGRGCASDEGDAPPLPPITSTSSSGRILPGPQFILGHKKLPAIIVPSMAMSNMRIHFNSPSIFATLF